VVIVGAGFAGLSAARALKGSPVDITLVDRRNHHLFQPLLYQVATAGLAPTQIASPIRTVLRDQANVRVVLAEASGVDLARKQLLVGPRSAPFDYLVLATGAAHAYFGHEGWAAWAPGLKSLDDALGFRRRILSAFEAAETACDPAERARLLTFVIVGAGPTGVELAGAIAELARRALATDFRAIRGESARVVLVEAADRALGAFDPRLSDYARRALERLGVEVRLGVGVTACDEGGVALGEERIPAANVFWAAGVQASPAGAWLGAALDRAGRVVVAPDLSVKGAPDVFVVGDLAALTDAAGRIVPGVAPAAKQEGVYVGGVIAARVAGRAAPPPFRYADAGSLATIGRREAVAQFGRLKLTGAFAWLVWSVAHIWFLIGFRNRLAVAIDWMWSYVTFDRGARLITGDDQPLATANAHLAGRCACETL